MTKRYSFLLAFSLTILLFSCADNATFTTNIISEPINAEDYLDTYVGETVIFHFSHNDTENDRFIGWIIDKSGEVKTYEFYAPELATIPLGGTCSETQLSDLLQASKPTGIQVDLDKLVANYKRINKASNGSTIDRADETVNKSDGIFAYYAFKENEVNYSDDGMCDSGASYSNQSQPCTDEYHVVLLDSEGLVSKENSSVAAQDILIWLKEIQEAL